jgi:hypothetical protein
MKESEERSYPLKSLHDFLSELDYEWDKFRRASIIGIVTSGVLLIFLFPRILSSFLALIRKPIIGLFNILNDVIFLFLIAAFVVYEIFLLLSQYKFFKKWEKRVGLLLHLEERIMKDRFEENVQ